MRASGEDYRVVLFSSTFFDCFDAFDGLTVSVRRYCHLGDHLNGRFGYGNHRDHRPDHCSSQDPFLHHRTVSINSEIKLTKTLTFIG